MNDILNADRKHRNTFCEFLKERILFLLIE